MKLTIRRLAYGLGAEVRDLDITAPLGPDVVAAIRQAWLDHGVLVFGGQDLTLDQHIAFSRNFGELEAHPVKRYRQNASYPEIFEVTNKLIDGKPSESANVGRVWHTDGSVTTRPPTGSLLHCHELPEVGGDTWFANLYLAYETLSPALQQMIEPLELVHDVRLATQRSSPGKEAGDHADVPAAIQPLVRTHPETGRKALYINPAVASHFHGMTREESAGLIDYLARHATRAEYTYRHRWTRHDLVMWDNRCTLHLAAGDFAPGQIRHMCRTTLVGEASGRILSAA